MDLKEAIFNRKTIRSFENRPVQNETLKELIESAIYAPSACNQQAWNFILVDNLELKKKICKNYGSPIIQNSPVGILVLYRKDVSLNYKMYKDHIQSASASIQNILLTAYEKGLGACWICDLPSPSHIRKTFGIPKQYEVIAYVALGYPKEYLSNITIKHYNGDILKTKIRERKYTIDQVFSYNKFNDTFNKNQTKKYLFIKANILKIICSIKHNKKLRKLINV